MRVELKEYKEQNRSMYVIYPAGERLSCYEKTMITVLRENDTREDIDRLCASKELEELVDSQRFVILFLNPIEGRWNYNLEESMQDDLNDIR